MRMTALGRKDQKQDDVYKVCRTARMLDRIFIQARETKADINLHNLLVSVKFDMVVDTAKKLSTEKDVPTLNVGKSIGHLLSSVCQSKYCASLRTRDQQEKDDANDFKKLIEAEWNSRVNRSAVRRINSEKRTHRSEQRCQQYP
jgi:hypothetical protein